MKIKRYLFYILSFIIFTVLFYILRNASIGKIIYPFAFGMLFALGWSNQKVWLLSPAYIVANILYSIDLYNIISSLAISFVFLISFYLHIIFKKNMKIWELGIFAFISQICEIIFEYLKHNPLYYGFINALIGILFMYIIISVLDAVLVRGLAYKFTGLEIISGGILLAVLGNGLNMLQINFFSFLKLFASFIILVVSFTGKKSSAVIVALLLGIGTLLENNNPVFIAPFAIWSISISLCKNYKKFLMPIILIAIECLCGFYFNLYYGFTALCLIPVAFSCVVFICIPNKIYDKVRSLLSNNLSRVAVKDVVNRNRELLHNRLGCLSEAFKEVDKTFRKMANVSLSEESMRDVLKRELKKKVCDKCPEKNRCYRAYEKETEIVFNEISKVSFNKGKISVLDIPNFMNAHCGMVSTIISETNVLCNQYKRYQDLVGNIDASKLLVAEQMGGVAVIMSDLAREVNSPIMFDNVREEKIIEELLTNGIICEDVLVVEKGVNDLEVTLVIRNEDKHKDVLCNIVGKNCGCELYLEKLVAFKPGWSTVVFSKIPKLDVAFGVSIKTKDGSSKSGDCYSIQRLSGDKFMFALCDGMGSGEKAKEISENAINLIENFYKAGFDSELIMSSINKLLSLQKEDVFSAVDISIIDLNECVMNLVKMGSPSCYLVNKEECEIIQGNSLPLGVVQNAQFSGSKRLIKRGDYLIMTTDGVSDSFENDDKFAEFICSIKLSNPQDISDEIMKKVLDNNFNVAKDDMSIIVVKIF